MPHEGRRALLGALRDSGDPALLTQADELERHYHARELALLSHDVYDVARQSGAPPAGWVRGSEHPALLHEAMPGLGLSEPALLAFLQPNQSGFRAEIYLPDPDVLGPGYRPTLVFKGSANEVIGPDGTPRSTAVEDFFANNFPQSVGLQTDYYDRAMELAVELQSRGVSFDLAGHSLGGGMASAASAVTGMRAVTFNAAGVHPETASRFSEDNGGFPLYDTGRNVTAWQVQGDLLNAGVQGDLASLGALDRARIAGLMTDVSRVMQGTTGGRALIEDRLMPSIAEDSRAGARAFLDRLAEGDTARLIAELPQAAGERRAPLTAMTADELALVRRDDAASLGELQRLAAPVLSVGLGTARGAELGRTAGGYVADGGQWVGNGLDRAGDAARDGFAQMGALTEQGYGAVGITINRGAQAAGHVAGAAREIGAGLEATVDRGQGWAQYNAARVGASGMRALGGVVGWASEDGRAWLDARADGLMADGEAALAHNQAQAEQATARGQQEADARRQAAGVFGEQAQATVTQAGAAHRQAYVYVGEQLNAGLDVAGEGVRAATVRAPDAGAALGGTTGFLAAGALTYQPGTAHGAYNLYSTVRLATSGPAGVQEALGRHGMESAMIPSLDREIGQVEAQARAQLQQVQQGVRDGQAPVRQDTPGASPGVSPSGDDHAGVTRTGVFTGVFGGQMNAMVEALRSGDTERFSGHLRSLADSPQGQAWLQAGHARLDPAPEQETQREAQRQAQDLAVR